MICRISWFAVLLSFSFCLFQKLFAEDVELRKEAVRLMERANAVSRQTNDFHAENPGFSA
jgi:hypothetical protein